MNFSQRIVAIFATLALFNAQAALFGPNLVYIANKSSKPATLVFKDKKITIPAHTGQQLLNCDLSSLTVHPQAATVRIAGMVHRFSYINNSIFCSTNGSEVKSFYLYSLEKSPGVLLTVTTEGDIEFRVLTEWEQSLGVITPC